MTDEEYKKLVMMPLDDLLDHYRNEICCVIVNGSAKYFDPYDVRRAIDDKLREMSGRHVTITTTEEGEVIAVTWQDDDHKILKVIWEKKKSCSNYETVKAEFLAGYGVVGKYGFINPTIKSSQNLTDTCKKHGWDVLDFVRAFEKEYAE